VLPIILALVVTLMFGAGLVAQKTTHRKVWDLRGITDFVTRGVLPGDIVLVPSSRVFWGWSWYFVGPGSIDPLAPATELWSPEQDVRTITGHAEADADHATWLVYRRPEELGEMRSLLDAEGATIDNWSFARMYLTRIQPPAQKEDEYAP
jgi:hypothetical protein